MQLLACFLFHFTWQVAPPIKGSTARFLLSESRFLFLLLHHNVSPLFVLLSKLQMCFCILARGSATRKTCFEYIVKSVSRKCYHLVCTYHAVVNYAMQREITFKIRLLLAFILCFLECTRFFSFSILLHCTCAP